MEPSTNLTDVSADRLQIWNVATASHEDVREVFINNSRITEVARVEQRVGDEIDIVLAYDQPNNEQVPALADLVAYIEQERLGTGSVVNKHYNITRNNTALIQDVEVIPRRTRREGCPWRSGQRTNSHSGGRSKR
jgi:hypothetical protein